MSVSGRSWAASAAERALRIGACNYKGDAVARLAALAAKPPRRRRIPAGLASRKRIDTVPFGVFPAFRFGSRPGARAPLVVYLHGGAYLDTFTLFHLRFLCLLAREAGAEIVAPDYPLAPHATCAQAMPFLLSGVRALAEGNPGRPIILMGDSAGGGLALALAQETRHDAVRASRVILLSPWLDLACSDPNIARYAAADPMLDAEALKVAGRAWAGDLGTGHRWASPLHGPVDSLPPTTIFAGTREILLPEAVALHGKLEAAGVRAELVIGPGMNHVWPLYPIPEGRESRRRIAQLLDVQ